MRNKILTELYNSRLIEKLANTYSSKLGNLNDDWIQQMYLTICELPEEQLIDLYNKGELTYYIYYVCRAQAYNDMSDFWKLHKGRVQIDYSIDDPNYKEPQENEDYE